MARRQRNIEAFTDKRGVVHPIRRSSGYDDEKTGSTDFDWRDWAAEEREQRQDEERELKKEYARYHPEAGKSLATFVRQRGGFRYDGIHDGEIDRLRKAETGTTGLVSLDKGKGLTFKRGRGLKPDRMLEAAIEAGVVSPDTSLSRFMDDVEMSATKRNPFPTATVEKAWQAWRKAEKAKSPKAQALETKFVKVYMASQKKNPERTIKHDSTGEVAPAHRVGTTRTGHVIYQYVHGWRPMFSYRQDKDGNWIAKTPRPKRRKNFTIKAAGRLKVGNPRQRTGGTHKQFSVKGKVRTVKVVFVPSSYYPGWTVDGSHFIEDKTHARRYAKWIADGAEHKQNPPTTLKLEGVDYNVVTWETAADMDAKGYKNIARTMRENKALAQVGLLRPAGKTLYEVILFDNGRHSKIISLGRVKNPVKRKNISIKVGGKTRFKASKKGVSIGGRIQLKANPKPLRTKTLTCSFCKAKQTGKMFPGWLTASPLSGYKWKAKCPSCRQARARLENPGARRVQRLYRAAVKASHGSFAGGETPAAKAKIRRAAQAGRKLTLKRRATGKDNPGRAKKNGSISERRQDRLWRSAQKAQKAGKTALADQRLTRSAALARKVQDKWYSQSRVEDRQKRYKEYARKTRNGIFETFTGRKATKQTALNAPDGTPKRLDKLGKLIGLYAENGTIKPRVPVWLCSDSKGKLHLATSAARLIDGGPQSFGEVKKIEYETTKKHLDGKPTVYFHHFGEEGGKRPTLHADGKGGLKLRGGSYKIRAEGIRD